jgi:hypothetical protein
LIIVSRPVRLGGVQVVRTLAFLPLPMEGEEPTPWWAIATPPVLFVTVGVFHVVRYWRRRNK